ncbi:transglycosylase domain-containing protein [Pandoraea sp.]|uniref:transglycosylase domain-containing protein n=1 Tax=Pandoraea sp. TaxID=1883445 RepID=UPI0011F83E25|nr:transglycosylase domain-containing protein [Pandoraea sp.]TAL53558.1 MAG: glycosyl transferase family 51 [Pandoraea sp.]TAM14899.1 MAG: glycosyl transferase family 51 [Pandoraea sp.]
MLATLCGAVYLAVALVAAEMQSSRWQAYYLTRLDRRLSYRVRAGPSDAIRFPGHGPYDLRLGYAQLPRFTHRLAREGFDVASQARISPEMARLMDRGWFAPYPEKNQAGLRLLDCDGLALYRRRFPRLAYADFRAIPPVLVNSLLFIEDHDLLDTAHPMRNPAIDWRRFSRALLDQGLHLLDRNHPTPGGSTLATQIEKYRHSPGGRTVSRMEKLRQMASASVRAYLDGENTLSYRQHIVLTYFNTVPLAARAGHGAIEGIGDGLALWYGEDFHRVNQVLRRAPGAPGVNPRRTLAQARAYKEALSLIIAQRGPSFYLQHDMTALGKLTDHYLELLAKAGVIAPQLRDAALALPLQLAPAPNHRAALSFVTRKAVTGLRTRLSTLLGVDTLYHLDRLDLSASTSIDRAAQNAITAALMRARTPAGARAAGIYGVQMLRPADDPGRLRISFTLYEHRGDANWLRVQADTVDEPFDLNRDARLNLGSTAKLRTLTTYLEIVTALHRRYASLSPAALRRLKLAPEDALSRWAVDYLMHAPNASLPQMLGAAMQRRYSANPGEAFATGGGLQRFHNFAKWENSQIFTVQAAFQNSVNLVFVRLMRDIVRYEILRIDPTVDQWLAARQSPQRQAYLARFADMEGSEFLRRFYRAYHGKTPDDALDLLLQNKWGTPVRLATALRTVEPAASEAQFARAMRRRLPATYRGLSDRDLQTLYTKYDIDHFSLNDRAYLVGVHPLELWLVAYLHAHPGASLAQVLRVSHAPREEAYAWLFKARSRAGQTNRIRHLLEIGAFQRIDRDWRRLGYPFGTLTPSLATAIGASGDRPAALAQLIGLILNHGVQWPAESVRNLQFAGGTPYETNFARRPTRGARLLPAAVADTLHRALLSVVDGGTAIGLRGVFDTAGGKTGTGTQTFSVYAPGGRLIATHAINRSATFVFFVGNRLFGSITAYVHEPYASRYTFTSAMAVQLLRSVAPIVKAMAAPHDAPTPLACHG